MTSAAGTATSMRSKHPQSEYIAAVKDSRAKLEGWPERQELDSTEQDMLNEYQLRYGGKEISANTLAFHRTWWMALSFFAGMQWLKWDESMSTLVDRKVPSWRIRYVANKILPNVLRMASKLVADPVTPRVLPVSRDREDVVSARLAEDVVSHLTRVLDYEEVRDDRTLWALICGSGFSRVAWDPRKGAPVFKDGRSVANQGDVVSEVIPPFCIRVPERVTKHENLPWIVIDTLWTMERIFATFPDKWQYVAAETDSVDGTSVPMEHRVASIVGSAGTVFTQDAQSSQGYARVREMLLGPTPKAPKGMQLFVTGDNVVLKGQANPYVELGIENGIAIVKQDYVPMPGRYFGLGLVEQLMPPQEQYNRSRAQIIENADSMSRPKWLLPRGHGIPETSITSRPGEVLEYNPSLPKPEQIAGVPLPNYVIEHQERCLEEIQDISATHDVSEAKAPASVRSGVAIQLLQAGDNAVVAIPKKKLIRADRLSMNMMLAIVAKKYTELRIIQVAGRDRTFEAHYFTGADLRGHTSVFMTAESGLLESKAARQQQILDYIQLKVLDPANPAHQKAILQMLDLGTVDDYVRKRTIDERNAQFENDLMGRPAAEGRPPVVPQARDFEDHEVHIEEHNLFRKSPEYRLLPIEQQQAIDMHVSQHQQMLAVQVQNEMAQTESTKGAPGEKGTPSPEGSGPSGQASHDNKSKESGSPGAEQASSSGSDSGGSSGGGGGGGK